MDWLLAAQGRDRDGKRDKLQVNYGLLADRDERPVAVSVFAGNANGAKTLLPQVGPLRERFGVQSVAVVVERGMISQKQIDAPRERPGMDWITALRSETIRVLRGNQLQPKVGAPQTFFTIRPRRSETTSRKDTSLAGVSNGSAVNGLPGNFRVMITMSLRERRAASSVKRRLPLASET